MSTYKRLKELLEKETYPHRYLHKFIGAKTDAFMDEVEKLEMAFPTAKRLGTRETRGTGGTPYIAVTLEFMAESADEIIRLHRATSFLQGLKVIL